MTCGVADEPEIRESPPFAHTEYSNRGSRMSAYVSLNHSSNVLGKSDKMRVLPSKLLLYVHEHICAILFIRLHHIYFGFAFLTWKRFDFVVVLDVIQNVLRKLAHSFVNILTLVSAA